MCDRVSVCLLRWMKLFHWSVPLPNSKEYQAAHICFCQVYLFLSRAAVKVISYPVILLTYIPSITLGIICKLSMMCRLVTRMEMILSSFLYFQRITNFPNDTTKSKFIIAKNCKPYLENAEISFCVHRHTWVNIVSFYQLF